MMSELRKKSKSTPKLKLEAVGAAIRLVSHDSDDERGGTSFFKRRSSKRLSGDSFMSKYSDDRDAFIDPESPWTGSFSRKIRESPYLECIQESPHSGDYIDMDAIKSRKGSYLSVNFGDSDSSLDDEEEKYLHQLREFDEMRLKLDQEQPIYSNSATNPLVSNLEGDCETLPGSANRLVKKKPAPLPLAGVPAAAASSGINTPMLPPSSPPPPTPSEAPPSITGILRSSSSVPVLRVSSTAPSVSATPTVGSSTDDSGFIAFRSSLHRPSISQSSIQSGMSVSSSILYPPTKLHSDTDSMTTAASSILTPTSSAHTSPALSSSPCTFETQKPGRLLSLPSFAPTHKLEKLQRDVNEMQDKARQLKKELAALEPIANGNPYKYPREQRQESKKKYDELNHQLEVIEKQKYETGIKLTRAWKRYRESNGSGTEFWAHSLGV